MYKPNAIGPFGRAGDTWCNYSTYDVLEATGFHTEGLYNSGSARSTSANDAAKNLIEMEKRGKVVELSPQEAQQKANEGYTVIVAWYNKTIPSETNQNGTAEYHGHLSTVRPNPKEGYDDSDGPLLANIGSDVEKLSTFFVFGNAYRVRNEIKFYYDPNQDFVFRENKMWCKGEGR
jgi:hypothetical protein